MRICYSTVGTRRWFGRLATTAAAVVLVAGCASSPSGTDCDQVCQISNGASAASATTYWRIPLLACGQLTCFTKIAFFADGTGEVTSGTNNCLRDFASVSTPTPAVVTFSWTKTGPSTMLLSGSAFACTPVANTSSGTVIGSFTSISGGVAAGVFTANLNGGAGISASLLAGTF